MGIEYTRTITTLGNVPIAGSVILADDFEHLLNWTKVTGEGDYIFELDPTIAKHGKHSLHLKTRTTGAAEADIVKVKHNTHLLTSKILTFICAFRHTSKTPYDYMTFQYNWLDGTNQHSSYIRYHPNVPSWSYGDSTGAPQVIAGFGTDLSADAWHLIISKVNFDTDKYISLQVDHLFSDLSAHSVFTFEHPFSSHLEKSFVIKTVGAAPCELYIDQVLLHEL